MTNRRRKMHEKLYKCEHPGMFEGKKNENYHIMLHTKSLYLKHCIRFARY